MLHTYTTQALWTHRKISYESSSPSLDNHISHFLQRFESRYSRFLSTSLLSQLNRNKQIQADEEFDDILSVWYNAYIQTNEVFSPFVWTVLNEIGYDEAYSFTWVPSWSPPESIYSVTNGTITIWSQTNFDIWGYGKWYMIDLLADFFQERWIQNWIINWWGDIRFHQSDEKCMKPIGIPHPLDATLLIAERQVFSGAIATSSSLVRKRWNNHHIIDPNVWASCDEGFLSVSVFSSTACSADIWATTLYVWWKEQLTSLSQKWWWWYIAVVSEENILYTDVQWLTVYAR